MHAMCTALFVSAAAAERCNLSLFTCVLYRHLLLFPQLSCLVKLMWKVLIIDWTLKGFLMLLSARVPHM